MTGEPWALGPRAARVFYAVADAWADLGESCDPVSGLAAAGLDARQRRRIERRLQLLEWSPRLALRSTSGFSWLPRAARRAWLERLATRAPAAVRELRGLVELSIGNGAVQSRVGGT